MAVWLQHLLVLTLVGGCALYAIWGAVRALVGGRSRLGSCCSKGCSTPETSEKKDGSERIVFLPVEMLGKKRP